MKISYSEYFVFIKCGVNVGCRSTRHKKKHIKSKTRHITISNQLMVMILRTGHQLFLLLFFDPYFAFIFVLLLWHILCFFLITVLVLLSESVSVFIIQ